MAVAIPLLAGLGAGATASFLGATALTSAAVGIGTGLAVNSMMNQSQPQAMAVPDVPGVATTATDTTTVDTSSATGSEETSINDVVGVQTTAINTADTSVDNTVYTAGTSVGTAAGGAETAAAASLVSQGPAEDEAIGFYERGRRSTILTTAQGLLSDTNAATSMLRQRRGLTGTGLIA